MVLEEDTSLQQRNAERIEIANDCVSVGQYVTLILVNVDDSKFDIHMNNQKFSSTFCQPLLLSGLFKHENRMSVVNFTVRKSVCDTPVKSKDVLDIHYGFRRSVCKPLFLKIIIIVTRTNLRFLQPGRFVAMTAYLPITYSPPRGI